MIGRFKSSESTEAPEPKSFDDFDLRLGDVMRGERATLGKSLLDVQRELKIKAAYIAAIENSDPDAFESQGFIAGYVRSYARYLNMDPEWAFKTFCEESGFTSSHGMVPQASSTTNKRDVIVSASAVKDPLADPNASFVPRGEAMLSRIEPGAVGSFSVMLALIAAIGFGGWTVLQEIQRVQFAPADHAAGTDVIAADPLAEPELVTADANAEALDRLYRPDALETPVLVARDAPIATLDPREVGAFADIATANAESVVEEEPAFEPAIQVVEDSAPVVKIVAVRPAWIRVRGADGTVLFETVMNAGQEYELPATEEPPVLRVGESGAIYFSINGEHYGPAGPSGTVTASIDLGSEALKEQYTLADLSQDDDLARVVAEAAAIAPSE